MAEMRSSKGSDQRPTQAATPAGPVQQTLQQGLNLLMGTVLGRADLSEIDVETILGSLTKAKDKVTEQVGKVADQTGLKTAAVPYSTIRADVENYLLNTYSWQMKPEKIEQEFRDVLYDHQLIQVQCGVAAGGATFNKRFWRNFATAGYFLPSANPPDC